VLFTDSSVTTPSSHPAAAAAAHQYHDVAAVYDVLMAGVPHNLWLARIERALRDRDKPRAHSVLDVACGTGIVTELLWRRGYKPIVGVDISAEMIDIARTKAMGRGAPPEVRFEVQDVTALDLGGATFDLAVSMFDSLNYVTDPDALARAFVRIHGHLNPGGVLAFDLNSLYALSHDLFTQVHLYGPVRHRWKAHWDRETRLCRVVMEFEIDDKENGGVREFQEVHVQRAYAIPEVKSFLEEAGFVKVEVFGNYGDRPPTTKSDRLLFVAERS
jgi:ubiquinone/menaquinone biosynthesis C-methylase UbiE